MNSFYGGKVGPQGDCVKNILEVLTSDCGARNDSNTKKYIIENYNDIPEGAVKILIYSLELPTGEIFYYYLSQSINNISTISADNNNGKLNFTFENGNILKIDYPFISYIGLGTGNQSDKIIVKIKQGTIETSYEIGRPTLEIPEGTPVINYFVRIDSKTNVEDAEQYKDNDGEIIFIMAD